MSLFYVWNPIVLVDDERISRVAIIRGQTDAILNGTVEFVEQILAEWGINQTIVRWEVIACRTTYFSDYLDEEEWQDRWQSVWQLEVELANVSVRPKESDEWRPTSAVDASWSFDKRLKQDTPRTCWLIADFAEQETMQAARAALESDEPCRAYQQTLGVATPVFYEGISHGERHQLQLDIGRFDQAFYASGAEYAAYVLKKLMDCGASVHYSTTLR
ncbi:MAG: hypothetical protein ACPG8W_13985 [Candidatus Promineifilaceae bacterium]